MKITELIDKAAKKAGSQAALAEQLGTKAPRVSEWKQGGANKPSTGQLGRMAEIAGLPVLETIAAVTKEIDTDFAPMWERVAKKATAAGVTVAALTSILIGLMSYPDNVKAAQNMEGSNPSVSASPLPLS